MSKITNKIQSLKKTRLEAIITTEQEELLQKAALIQGRSLTDFIVFAVTEVAQAVIEENNTITLSKQDSELLVRKILESPLPSKKLQQAASEYKQLMNQK